MVVELEEGRFTSRNDHGEDDPYRTRQRALYLRSAMKPHLRTALKIRLSASSRIYGGAVVPRTTSYSGSIQSQKRQPPHDVFTTLPIIGEQQSLVDAKDKATRSL